MSNKQSYLPSHKALIINTITNWAAIASLIIVVIVLLSAYTVRYSIERDCQNPYHRNVTLPGHYWLTIHAGSTKVGCVQ